MTDVTCTISTKGRYHTTLPLALISIATQRIKPDHIIIYDDNDVRTDLREIPEYRSIFNVFLKNNISWTVLFGDCKGQVYNHNRALTKDVKTKYIWRIDDDEVAEPNVLEELLRNMIPGTGAVSCKVWFATMPNTPMPRFAKNSFKSKLAFQPQEWYVPQNGSLMTAEHLYSTFLFDKDAAIKSGGYNMNTSIVGHREETILTHRMYRNGYNLKITPKAVVHHMHQPDGGIRSFNDGSLWAQDDDAYKRIMVEEWGYSPDLPDDNVILLNNGLGDHYAFKQVLPKILDKNPDVVIAACFPEVFEGTKAQVINMHEITGTYHDHSKWDIYKWCVDNQWSGRFTEAIERMYL